MLNLNSKKIIGLLLFSILFITFSCDRDDSGSGEITENMYVNDWIKSYMDVVYFWNTRMPSNTSKKLYPADYFESLLYRQEDRHSFIAPDFAELYELMSGVQMEAGYDFSLFLKERNSEEVVGIVNYIKPNSEASKTNLKRGDLFVTINGTRLMTNNVKESVNKMSAQHVLGVLREEGNIQSISLSVSRYEENPILLDSIYEIGGKKIAYLIYNNFATDKGNYSYTYLKELNNIFGEFKQAGVNELILDLRYNSGGKTLVASALASMISNRTSSELFCYDQYNSIMDSELKKELGENYNKTFFDDYLNITDENGRTIDRSIPVNKIAGLTRLYVLTSRNTASASELIISGLKPYMDVILIGEQTTGKNTGMLFIYELDKEKQKHNRWAILPIVVKAYNSLSQSDYDKGFAPDLETNEYAVIPMPPLGNTGELLLEAALVHIGVQPASKLRSAGTGFDSQPIMSSTDRTPVRKNMFR
jgi:C-terminal processing protease CtpA/Prc